MLIKKRLYFTPFSSVSIVDFEQVNVCSILRGNHLLIVENKKNFIDVLNVFKVGNRKGWNNGTEV